MYSPFEAWQVIENQCQILRTESVPIEQALGHIIAEPIVANRDLPPANRSAMDGYAVRITDVAVVPARLRVVGEIAAGSKPPIDQGSALLVEPGTCMRVFTGANIPFGADGVVIIEQTRCVSDNEVEILSSVERGANILRQGEDARSGDVLLAEPTEIQPLHIAVCASVGRQRVAVVRKPRVALIVTGAELLPVSAIALEYQSYDTNGPMLNATLRQEGFPLVEQQMASDDEDDLLSRLTRAIERADAVVFSAGVSVGRYDLVPQVIKRAGARILIHGVAMKPGKPFLYAVTADGKPIFGLPGNPLSAITTFHEFVLPALRRMAGIPSAQCRPTINACLAGSLKNKKGRYRFYTARLSWSSSSFVVEPIPSKSSSDLVSGSKADGALIVSPEVETLLPGTPVSFRPWRRFLSHAADVANI